MSSFNLNDHVFRLLQSDPFFAALSRRIDKKSSTAVPTAGVRVCPETARLEMVYNPDFFEPLTDEQRTGVLIHEFYHLVFEHVLGRLPDELAGAMNNPTSAQRSLFQLWNIAADLSINCLIGRDRLPDNCCFPGGKMFEDLPEDRTAEWYFEKLKEKAEENGPGDDGDDGEGSGEGEGEGEGSGNGFNPDEAGQFDDHSGWSKDSSNSTKEIARERLREAMKGAVEEANRKGWGSVGAGCRKEIMDSISTKVDWKKVLSWFIKCSQRSNKKSTPRRLNKRYPYIHPGRKVTRLASVAISIDQSGSVSDQMLATFYAELNSLANLATFTVIPFDTDVAEDKVYVWRKGESRKKERVLCGGTCFDAPTEYVNAGDFDGHIILTDMCAPKPKPSKCPRLWMTDKANASRQWFETNERVIAVD